MVTRILASVFVCACLSAPARADDRDSLYKASMVMATAAHGADLGSTQNCLGSGRCHEVNQFLVPMKKPAVFGAVQMGVAGAQLWLVDKVYVSGHQRWARVINYATAAGFGFIAYHNAKVAGQ